MLLYTQNYYFLECWPYNKGFFLQSYIYNKV